MGKEAIIWLWVLCLPVSLTVLCWYWFSGGNATCRGARSSAARHLILGLELCSNGAGCNPPYCQRRGEPGMIPGLKTNTILFHQVIYSFHRGSAAGIRLSHLVFCFEFVLSSPRQPPDRWRGGVSGEQSVSSLSGFFLSPLMCHVPIKACLIGHACFPRNF